MPRKFPKDDNEQLKRTNPDKQLPEQCNCVSKNNINRSKCRLDANKKGKGSDSKWISENCIKPSIYVYNIGDAMGSAESSNFYSKKQTDRGGNAWKNLPNESRSSKRNKRCFGKSSKKEILNNIGTSNRFDVLNSHENDSSADIEMKDFLKTTKNSKKNEIQYTDSQSTLINSTLEAMLQDDTNISSSAMENTNSSALLHSDPNLIQVLNSNNLNSNPNITQSTNNVSSRSDSEVRSPNFETLNRKKKKHKWEMRGKNKMKQKSVNEILSESKPMSCDSCKKKSILKKEIEAFENNDMILPFDYSSGDDDKTKASNSTEPYISTKMFQAPSGPALSTRSLFYGGNKPKKNVRFKNEVVIIYYTAESIQAVQNGSFIATTVEPLKLALQQQQRNRELRNKHAYARTMFPTSFSFGAF